MAYDITNENSPFTPPFTAAVHSEVTDATASTSAVDCTTGRKNFRALVYFTSITVGTTETYLTLEVADDSGFATNRRILDIKPVGQVVATVPRAFVLQGQHPLVAGQRYMRLAVTFGSGASGTFDAILEAA
jgi:hypothetical protein